MASWQSGHSRHQSAHVRIQSVFFSNILFLLIVHKTGLKKKRSFMIYCKWFCFKINWYFIFFISNSTTNCPVRARFAYLDRVTSHWETVKVPTTSSAYYIHTLAGRWQTCSTISTNNWINWTSHSLIQISKEWTRVEKGSTTTATKNCRFQSKRTLGWTHLSCYKISYTL